MNQVIDWTVPLDHPAFAGHFTDMPILPGVVLLDMVTHMMAEANQINAAHYQISSAKFLSPVKPGDVLRIEQSLSGKGVINFNILTNNGKVATGSIIPSTPL